MLRDGHFIKEDPPRIGSFYVPRFREEVPTPEERLMQSILLGYTDSRQSFLSRVLGFMLRI
jgi:hypothetical protein